MKSVRTRQHPITKPLKIDVEGAIAAITSDWDAGGNRTIRFHLKTRHAQPGDPIWIITKVDKVNDKEIIIDITQYDH